MSRKVVSALFSSVDGVVEDPFTFQFDSFDERMGELMDRAISPCDEVVMGRRTYDEWSEYWPAQGDDDFGGFINPVRKHVASRTLDPASITWNNTTLIEGDLHDFLRGLKEGEGGDITIAGSISTVRELFLAGLIDTLTLMVHPAIAGAGGRHLFREDDPTTRLELVDHEITPAGNAVLTYALRS